MGNRVVKLKKFKSPFPKNGKHGPQQNTHSPRRRMNSQNQDRERPQAENLAKTKKGKKSWTLQ